VEVDQCLRCGGLWLARQSFERLSGDRETRAALLGYLPPTEPPKRADAVRYRPCPACKRVMNRTNYGRISGVVVDVCKADGVWFDRDELRRVVDFIQAGGLEKARDRQIRDLKEAERQLAQAAHPASLAASPIATHSSGDFGFALGEVAVEVLIESLGSIFDGA
jgi:Zn-finger nucleic acid-binding protein